MGYILNGTTLRAPNSMKEVRSTQFAQNRTLNGAFNRDYFGSTKRIWSLDYENVNIADYAIIKTIYDTYLTNGTAISWQVSETNYTVAATSVIVELDNRSFKTKGSDYLSDFSLRLTEV